MNMPRELYVYAEDGKADQFSYTTRRVGDHIYVPKSLADNLAKALKNISDNDGLTEAAEVARAALEEYRK